MNQKINLATIEAEAWNANFQDGIWELSFGLLWVGLGCASLLDSIGIGLPYNILLAVIPSMIIQFAGKHFITVPRIGRAKYGPIRRTRQQKLRIISIITTIVLVVLVLLTAQRLFPGQLSGIGANMFHLLVGLFVFGIISIFGYFLDYSRMVLVGAAAGLTHPMGIWIGNYYNPDYAYPTTFAVAGTIIFMMGIIQLRRFLQTYPLPLTPAGSADKGPDR